MWYSGDVIKSQNPQQGVLVMNKNSTLVWQLKRALLDFSEKLSDGLTRPMLKFMAQMLYGLLVSQSIMLTDIGRALQEEPKLKKTVDRLSRNLNAFHQDVSCVQANYLEIVKPLMDDNTIYCLDPGDICKKYSRHPEGMGYILDGSEHKPALGWQLYEMVALTHKNKLPVPVYTKTVSPSDPLSDGQTEEIINAIRSKQRALGPGGTIAMDRAMDTNAIYDLCFYTKQKFIIRAKVDRQLFSDEGIIETSQIAGQMNGKFRLSHTDRKGKHTRLKVSFRHVRLPLRPDEPLTLVIVYGFGIVPMLLLTNLPVKGKETCLRIVKTYLCRWRIEEYYRFKKNQFDLENIRVQSLDSICALTFLLTILSGWIAMFANKTNESLLLLEVLVRAKRVYDIPQFTLYAVADGIFDILKFATRGIRFALLHPPPSQQLSLFKSSAFNLSAA
jgi:hypothetical protein